MDIRVHGVGVGGADEHVDVVTQARQLERNEWPDQVCAALQPQQLVEAYASSSEAAFATLSALNPD